MSARCLPSPIRSRYACARLHRRQGLDCIGLALVPVQLSDADEQGYAGGDAGFPANVIGPAGNTPGAQYDRVSSPMPGILTRRAGDTIRCLRVGLLILVVDDDESVGPSARHAFGEKKQRVGDRVPVPVEMKAMGGVGHLGRSAGGSLRIASRLTIAAIGVCAWTISGRVSRMILTISWPPRWMPATSSMDRDSGSSCV